MTTPTVHFPLSTIPTFNTIQHTPTQQLSLRVTPPSNVIQYMIGRPLSHTRLWNHPTRWSLVMRGWGIAMMSSVQEVLVIQAMTEDHRTKRFRGGIQCIGPHALLDRYNHELRMIHAVQRHSNRLHQTRFTYVHFTINLFFRLRSNPQGQAAYHVLEHALLELSDIPYSGLFRGVYMSRISREHSQS